MPKRVCGVYASPFVPPSSLQFCSSSSFSICFSPSAKPIYSAHANAERGCIKKNHSSNPGAALARSDCDEGLVFYLKASSLLCAGQSLT